ncbi:MAG: histidinol dehydrogenase [Prevotellaceae bacterium]|jgi:histidinol dehydrogenase|nr:histidinol dehydrogenase [Prevotellaceae bacterium]
MANGNKLAVFNFQTAIDKRLIQRPNKPKAKLEETVREVFAAIEQKGDKALFDYTLKFDKISSNILEISKKTIDESDRYLSQDLKDAIVQAASNIRKFHENQVEKLSPVETAKGVLCWRENRAIERVGIYVPGGSAPLFSTVLMLAIPAKTAGCKEIILCTPPNIAGVNPAILFAAKHTGVDRVFAVGGIQAIGAMACGTETIPKVSKIFGPGNQYVTKAKQIAQIEYNTAIDMPAGPSEVLIIADETCNPAFVAADLLSQAEHGDDSQVILLLDNELLAAKINSELSRQLEKLPRQKIAELALENARAIVMNNIDECIALSNEYAPEHLILACKNYGKVAEKVVNAGSVFLGNFSCESAGDYASGTNHTLPTNGYARAYSGVSLDSFIRKITFQEISEEGIASIGKTVEVMAAAESLDAHKNAMKIRAEFIANNKNKQS